MDSARDIDHAMVRSATVNVRDMIRYRLARASTWPDTRGRTHYLPVNATSVLATKAHAGHEPPFSRVLNVHDALLHDDPDKRRLNEARCPDHFPQAGFT